MQDFIKNIFISPDEPRLRAGWRILGQFILMGIFSAIFGSLFLITGLASLSVSILSSIFAITCSVIVARRFLDRRSFTSLGFTRQRHTLKDLMVGIGIPGIMMGMIFLVEAGFGWLDFQGFIWEVQSPADWIPELLIWTLVFLAVGYYEELLSRGYHLQNMEDGLNTVWAVLISSSIFGIAHLGNPNATWVSAVGILGAGIFLAYGYLRTRQMWLPIGLHIGWNFFEGPVFGFPVSGLDTFRLLVHHATGPELFTGGAFGPEAGLLSIFAMLLGGWMINRYTQGRLHDINSL